jgi:hypothetical protein
MLLQALNLHWLDHVPDQHDLCAHGSALVQIGEETLSDLAGGDWCVSAAALYLLRTLTADHTRTAPVGEHLIPCCGHAMYEQTTSNDVLIIGCANGIDWDVHHQGDDVTLRTHSGTEERITRVRWQELVLQFADHVAEFYAASAPKIPADIYEAAGYTAFQAEWSRRRQIFDYRNTSP